MTEDPKWIQYADDAQRRQFERDQHQKGWIARLLGLAGEKIGGPLKWLAWKLWGRRAAIRRMQKLALEGLGEQTWSRQTIEKEEDRLARHRDHLDSLKVERLPTPDSHDVN